MSVFSHTHMPPLDGATAWLNSEPLTPAGLRGHPVLVNFWTLTCINWLRQEPYVRMVRGRPPVADDSDYAIWSLRQPLSDAGGARDQRSTC